MNPGRLALLLPPLVALSACGLFQGDGATRIAFRLESEAGQLRDSGVAAHTFSYVPKGGYDDCSGAYDVQFSERGGLVVWCKDAQSKTVSSHITTYHLNFVQVPRTWNVEKKAGEAMRVELTRQGDAVVVTDVR
ncbi:hypothetical protein [Thermomonas sp.]|uniref:hypothetical protein n=1 Tax=Thermomonas sp. TaxID=1971895 RepID=UPI002C20EEA7|nr:hypothetical protein [Thermomonas sp.]HRO63826.1 hypothetical protein [Thermomonas sp.]